jgi:GMP synthase-like glutamine amidotransferase
VKTAPVGSEVLAQSKDCRIQALAFGSCAFSIQFHSELTLDMIDACLELPEYKAAFEALMGIEGIASFRLETKRQEPIFDNFTKQLYENWKRCALN